MWLRRCRIPFGSPGRRLAKINRAKEHTIFIGGFPGLPCQTDLTLRCEQYGAHASGARRATAVSLTIDAANTTRASRLSVVLLSLLHAHTTRANSRPVPTAVSFAQRSNHLRCSHPTAAVYRAVAGTSLDICSIIHEYTRIEIWRKLLALRGLLSAVTEQNSSPSRAHEHQRSSHGRIREIRGCQCKCLRTARSTLEAEAIWTRTMGGKPSFWDTHPGIKGPF